MSESPEAMKIRIDNNEKDLQDCLDRLESYHIRLREIEPVKDNIKIINENVATLKTMFQLVYDRLIGTLDKKGMIGDVEDLKAWRISQSTRTKSKVAWVYGVLGALIIKCFDWIPQLFKKL